MRKQLGFTLVEIAIVLFIVGLLLGGVLKGQELIKAARVNNIAAQLDEVKVAYLGFLDRYRSYPGDMPTAQAMVQIPAPGRWVARPSAPAAMAGLIPSKIFSCGITCRELDSSAGLIPASPMREQLFKTLRLPTHHRMDTVAFWR